MAPKASNAFGDPGSLKAKKELSAGPFSRAPVDDLRIDSEESGHLHDHGHAKGRFSAASGGINEVSNES